MGKLDGRVAIVTGGASGIGKASATLFAEEGAAVLVADIQDGRPVAGAIARAGGSARFLHADVSNPGDVQAMVEAAVDAFGGLHILFNNAGVDGALAALHRSSAENWDRVIAVNLKGPYLGMKYAIPAMLRSGGGSIISTSSVMGLTGGRAFQAYCAAKSGLIGLTRSAALDCARMGIRVNAICPGAIDTPMAREIMETGVAATPFGRPGTPEEVARLALFLAGDDSSFCTGACFLTDGGYVAR